MARIMGIDFGERRIGLAISDPLKITAQGLPTIDTKKIKDVFSYIKGIIESKGVKKIVVGMPRNMDGSIGFKGEAVSKFIKELMRRTVVEVITWDERLTTVQSQKSMQQMGIKQREKEAVDRISATLILQSYLDNLARKNDRDYDE